MLQNSIKLRILRAVCLIFTVASLMMNQGNVSVFAVVLSLTLYSTLVSFTLPFHISIGESQLRQYLELQKQGVPLCAKITFSGESMKQCDGFTAQGELR
jgi:hypothetical protein